MQKSLLRTYVTPELEQTIKARAEEKGLSVSATVDDLIRQSLEANTTDPTLESRLQSIENELQQNKHRAQEHYETVLCVLTKLHFLQRFHILLWKNTSEGREAWGDHWDWASKNAQRDVKKNVPTEAVMACRKQQKQRQEHQKSQPETQV